MTSFVFSGAVTADASENDGGNIGCCAGGASGSARAVLEFDVVDGPVVLRITSEWTGDESFKRIKLFTSGPSFRMDDGGERTLGNGSYKLEIITFKSLGTGTLDATVTFGGVAETVVGSR